MFDIRINDLAWSDPFRWLAAGWRDFRRAPGIGLFYGGCFMVMGWALLWVFESSPAYVLALSGGLYQACASTSDLYSSLIQGTPSSPYGSFCHCTR